MVQVGSALGSIHVGEPPATNRPPARHYLGGGSFWLALQSERSAARRGLVSILNGQN